MTLFFKYIVRNGVKAYEAAIQHGARAYHVARQFHVFGGVETYCMFIGYPRSGHSLVGSLLDAHPHAAIAHEVDALKYISAGVRKNRLFSLLLGNSLSSAKNGRRGSKYSYAVPNQWQGRFSRLRVIGDKKGGRSTRRLGDNPDLLAQLRDVVRVPVKIIHVIRNPYDNISTIAKRHDMSLRDAVAFYFSLCDTVTSLKTQIAKEDLFEMRHEAFVANPAEVLSSLCRFLGLEVTVDYVRDCSEIVFQRPRRTRLDAQWNVELRDLVDKGVARFSFLQGYNYGEGG